MVSRSEVVDAYRFILGRDPESEQIISLQENVEGWETLRRYMMDSHEFRLQVGEPRTYRDKIFDGVRPGDEDLLRRHLTPGPSEDGYIKNFVGTRMHIDISDATLGDSGRVYEDIPTVVGDYHAEAIEYIGVLMAIEAGSGPFVAVELGAGWGSWVVTSGHVARKLGRDPIRLYAVEASPGKVANMRRHFAANGFAAEDHTLLVAAVGPIDGYALFPLVDVTKNFGGEAVFLDGLDTNIEREGYERVTSITLDTLLSKEELVDLIHFDVQGAELEIAKQSIKTLNGKARYLIIGTHSRQIEGGLIELFLANDWRLVREQPALIVPSGDGREGLHGDGTQVWFNPRLDRP